MWNKVYLGALAVFLLLMFVLIYVSSDWLGSITRPEDVAAGYISSSGRSWYVLLFASLVLLVLANVVLWTNRTAWALWTTLLFFIIFILLQTFWLDRSFVAYLKDHGFPPGSYTFRPLLGAMMCIGAGALVFFNQLIVLRMHDKMYAKDAPVERLPEDEIPFEDTTTKDET